MRDAIVDEFGQAASDYLLDVYDEGIIDGLTVALRIVQAAPGSTTGLIKETILRLINNPPPREPK